MKLSTRPLLLLFFLLNGGLVAPTFGINTNSFYMSLFSQKTEIIIKDTAPITKTKYELIFNINDERAVAIFHSYTLYYSFFDKLEDLKVYTVNPQPGGKSKRIDIKDFTTNNATSSSVFFDDQKEININFLGLTVGSQAHIEYTVTTSETHFTDVMYIRSYMPIEKLQYELTVPKNVHVSFLEKNMIPDLVRYTKEEKKNETIHYWSSANIDEEKRYDDAPSRAYYSPHIIFKIDDYEHKGKLRRIAKSPQDLYDFYVHNIREVNKQRSPVLKQLADSIVAGAQSEREKVKRIYDWVKTNIRYVAFEAGYGGYVPRQATLVCNNKYGDCKDMSSLQFGLLQELGIEGHLTWIGTRAIPYTYDEVPLMNVDNHMILSVKDGSDWVFLDGTDPNGVYGLPAPHIQGKEAMIYLTDSTYTLAKVPVIDSKINLMTDTIVIQLKGNDLQVKSTSRYHGLIAGVIGNSLMYMTEKDKEDFAKETARRVSNNAILSAHTVPSDGSYIAAPFGLEYSVKNYVREIDKEKYMNPFLVKEFQNDHISDTDRIAPVSYKYNLSSSTTYMVAVPEGYKITYQPKNTIFKQAHFGFEVSFTQSGQYMICHQTNYINLPDLLLHKEEFTQWNLYVKKLNELYSETIIFESIK